MNLGYPLERLICFDGRRYRLRLAFDNVLRVYAVHREPLFSQAQRLQLSVEMLAGRRAGRLPVTKLQALFGQINAEFLNPDQKPHTPGEPRVLDFVQDAPLIYASFMQAYGINLARQRGRLDWRHFIALFQGLPENTKIREVMSIRRRPIPAPDKHNAEQIKALMEAKAYYAIKVSDEEAEECLQAGIDRMAAALVSRAKRGGV